MIRRDYLLRMIDQCVQALARSLKLTQEGLYEQAHIEVDQAIKSLTDLEARDVSTLSEAELTVLLLKGESTQVLHGKALLLVALLRRAGEVRAAEGKIAESRACNLKALNLLLEVLLREGPFEFPEYVPAIDSLVAALDEENLPLATSAALMQHFERTGQFAKAEDALFSMIDAEPVNRPLREFGRQFYERILRQPDDVLVAGNLPRGEVEAGLSELSAPVRE